jgi:hypothetical protein
MTNIKNWLLTTLLAIAGVLDLGFGLLNDLATELSIEPKIVNYFRIAIVIVSAVILKLQAPSTNPEKLQDLVHRAQHKKKE